MKYKILSRQWLDNIIAPWLSSGLIHCTNLALTITFLQICNIILYNNTTNLALTIGLLLTLLSIHTILLYVRTTQQNFSYSNNLFALQNKNFARLLTLEWLSISKLNPANLLNCLKQGAQKVTISNTLHCSYIDLYFIPLYLFVIAYIEPQLCAINILLLLAIFLIIRTKFQNLKQINQKQITSKQQKQSFLYDLFIGIHTVKSLNLEETLLNKFELYNNEEQAYLEKNLFLNQQISSTLNWCDQLNFTILLLFSSYFIIVKNFNLFELVTCIILTKILFDIFSDFLINNYYAAITKDLTEYNKFLNFPTEKINSTNINSGLKGHIIAKNLSFKYMQNQKFLFKKINFDITPGETIIIAGNPSCGKSTLLSILAGLLPPTTGSILVDNNNLYENLQLKQYINTLPQNGGLFEGSILENLTLFANNNNINNIFDLAKKLDLENLIENLPQGYNTKIGYSNTDLISRGFKQLILIVRALSNPKPILLIDDASTALDYNHYQRFINYLKQIKGQQTMIITSNQHEFIELADRTITLTDSVLNLEGCK